MAQSMRAIFLIRILGIDPGLNRTGYGVVEAVGRDFVVAAGVIRVAAGDLHQRSARFCGHWAT